MKHTLTVVIVILIPGLFAIAVDAHQASIPRNQTPKERVLTHAQATSLVINSHEVVNAINQIKTLKGISYCNKLDKSTARSAVGILIPDNKLEHTYQFVAQTICYLTDPGTQQSYLFGKVRVQGIVSINSLSNGSVHVKKVSVVK